MSAGPAVLLGLTPGAQDAIGHVRTEGRSPAPQGQSARRAAITTWLSVLLIALGGCSLTVPGHVSASAGQSAHSAAPSAGLSEAASAYLAAVDAATPSWRDLDATITANDFSTHRSDLRTQVNADAPFLTALRAIEFPPEAAPAAKTLIAAIQAYDDFLLAGYNDFNYFAAHSDDDKRLNETRAESSARLRDTLGLPPSTSSYKRP